MQAEAEPHTSSAEDAWGWEQRKKGDVMAIFRRSVTMHRSPQQTQMNLDLHYSSDEVASPLGEERDASLANDGAKTCLGHVALSCLSVCLSRQNMQRWTK